MSADESIFEKALAAASDAFQTTLNEHFGRSFDGSEADAARLLEEYRESGRLLRNGAALHLRTGLIDAEFTCWHSDFADENFGEETASEPVSGSLT